MGHNDRGGGVRPDLRSLALNASSTVGQHSRNDERSRSLCRCRSQIILRRARATTLIPSTDRLSPATGRGW